MSGFDSVAWFPLCAGLTGFGLVASWLAGRRRGVAAGMRGVAWSLLPLAAYLTGAVEMLWRIGTAVADWVGGFVFSPRVWSGVIVVGLAVVLFMLSGTLRRRSPRRGRAVEPSPSASRPAGSQREVAPQPRRRAMEPARKQPAAAPDDDDFSEVEEILRRRGIS